MVIIFLNYLFSYPCKIFNSRSNIIHYAQIYICNKENYGLQDYSLQYFLLVASAISSASQSKFSNAIQINCLAENRDSIQHHKGGSNTIPWAHTHTYTKKPQGQKRLWRDSKNGGDSFLVSYICTRLNVRNKHVRPKITGN